VLFHNKQEKFDLTQKENLILKRAHYVPTCPVHDGFDVVIKVRETHVILLVHKEATSWLGNEGGN